MEAAELRAAEYHRRTWTKEDAERGKERLKRMYRRHGIDIDKEDQG